MTECPECKSEKASNIMQVPGGDYGMTMYQCDECKKVFIGW